jgi:hypothetical protein
MATIEEYSAYHLYVHGAAGAFTAAASSMFTPGLSSQVTFNSITEYSSTAQKDSLLYDLLKQMERFEATSANIASAGAQDPVREIEDTP